MVRVSNSLFFTIRDGSLEAAQQIIRLSSLASLGARYKPEQQTTLFFAAARPHGQGSEALQLCKLLIAKGVPVDAVDALNQTALFFAAREGHAEAIRYLLRQGSNVNHKDSRGETALFYAVDRKRVDAVIALLEGGATMDVVNCWKEAPTSIATDSVLDPLIKERKRRRDFDEEGPIKRQRTALEKLETWVNEWPMKEKMHDGKVKYKEEDIVSSNDAYIVLKRPGDACAAYLRVLEKSFVLDHAQYFKSESWFDQMRAEDWCQCLGVIRDDAAIDAVKAIQATASGQVPNHFTLILVEKRTSTISGYVHASYTAKQHVLTIEHVKVDRDHMGKGAGRLLIDAAEEHSSSTCGWKCRSTQLRVLACNERAKRCYLAAGFKAISRRKACWKRHEGSCWLTLKKVHKRSFIQKKKKKLEKQ